MYDEKYKSYNSFLAIFFVISGLFGQFLSYSGLYLVHILTPIVLYQYRNEFFDLLKDTEIKWIFTLLVFTLASFFLSNEKDAYSILYLFRYLFALFFWVIICTIYKKVDFKKLFEWFVIINFVLIVVQVLTFAYGKDIIFLMNLGLYRVNFHQPYGTFWNPNDAGTFLVCVLPILFYFRSSVFVKFCCIASVFLIGSRLCFITILITLPFLLLYRNINFKQIIMSVCAVLILCFLGNFHKDYTNLYSRVYQVFTNKVDSIVESAKKKHLKGEKVESTVRRVVILNNLLTSVFEKPLFGHGPYSANRPKFHPQFNVSTSPHFTFLELIFNFGFVFGLTITISYLLFAKALFSLGCVELLLSLMLVPFASISMSSAYYALPLYVITAFLYSKYLNFRCLKS